MPTPPDDPLIDDPETLASLAQVFARYEAALLAHDVAALNAFFWNDARTLRYGIAEHSEGHAAIAAYRCQAPPVDPRRQLRSTRITTFGRYAGSACTEFIVPGRAALGRQTQTWVRFAEGWRIVAAHVSEVEPRLVAVSK